ncbi:MAG: hypothetical protein Q8942_05255 [Bacillota bacterium]|nr:hypothetical protein [Bacillota bacterium]
MFIIYKDNLYDLLDEETHLNIITRQKTKADKDFLSTGKSYYKEIKKDDKYIQDIFNAQFFVEWDSHLDDIDNKWEILTEHEYLKDNQVLLKFVNGILPGWTVEEQAICSKYVDIDECEDFSVVYTYTVKDGKTLKSPMVVEQKVSKDDFQKLVLQHQFNNI